jgi:hypothetical protein
VCVSLVLSPVCCVCLCGRCTALSMQSLLLRYQVVVGEERIERDLDRTFPLVDYFSKSPAEDPNGGQEMLKKVLRAYAAYDGEVCARQAGSLFNRARPNSVYGWWNACTYCDMWCGYVGVYVYV